MNSRANIPEKIYNDEIVRFLADRYPYYAPGSVAMFSPAERRGVQNDCRNVSVGR